MNKIISRIKIIKLIENVVHFDINNLATLEAVQEGQIKDNMSTNLKSEINPHKKYPESSSNKECQDKISIAEDEPCQNNNETNAFASGQQRPRENNSEMKTDRIKEDNERLTKAAADNDDVMIGNKNVRNLQHSKTACNDLKINQDAAKDILLQLEDVKKQRCKKAEIINLEKENDNESKNIFPQNTNIESRTQKNEPIKINEKSQGQENKKHDKDTNELIINGHGKKDTIDNHVKDKVPENLKINNASIRKTDDAHASPKAKAKHISNPNDSVKVNNPSISDKCLNGLGKDYDTNVIKEEIKSLKEELKRQIVENRATNGADDINEKIICENGVHLDTPEKSLAGSKAKEPEKIVFPSDDSVKAASTPKPKKKKVVKKINKSKKKESTPGRELPSEVPTESSIPTNRNYIPETLKPVDSIPSIVDNLDVLKTRKEVPLETANVKEDQGKHTLIQQNSFANLKDANFEHPQATIDITSTPI